MRNRFFAVRFGNLTIAFEKRAGWLRWSKNVRRNTGLASSPYGSQWFKKKGGPQAAAIDIKEIYFWEKNSVIARIM